MLEPAVTGSPEPPTPGAHSAPPRVDARDATDRRWLAGHVEEAVLRRRAEILSEYEGTLVDGEPVQRRLLDRAAAVLDGLGGRLHRSGGPPRPEPARPDGAAVLLRGALRAVHDQLPSHVDAPHALVEVAAAAHESIAEHLMPATGDHAAYLLDRLHRSHVDERRRVARELHDLVAHSVAVALQDLELFTLHRDRDSVRAEAKLAAALDNLRDTLEMLRAIAHDLRWSAAESGLAAALRAYVESGTFTLPTDLRMSGDESTVPPAVQGELFLVLREALRNAHVHAGARAVRVRVEISADRVRAVVDDDGDGFDSEARPDTPTGTGLASMRERVALLGGEIDVRSAPGRGTSIAVDVPLMRAWDDAED